MKIYKKLQFIYSSDSFGTAEYIAWTSSEDIGSTIAFYVEDFKSFKDKVDSFAKENKHEIVYYVFNNYIVEIKYKGYCE